MARLYYTDSFLTSFDARVVESGVDQGRPFVVLDRTAFYPTTGGRTTPARSATARCST